MFTKIASIALVLIAVCMLFGAGYIVGQREQDAMAIKVVLADMTVHTNTLERQQVEMRNTIANFALELRAVKNDTLSRIMRKYGL